MEAFNDTKNSLSRLYEFVAHGFVTFCDHTLKSLECSPTYRFASPTIVRSLFINFEDAKIGTKFNLRFSCGALIS